MSGIARQDSRAAHLGGIVHHALPVFLLAVDQLTGHIVGVGVHQEDKVNCTLMLPHKCVDWRERPAENVDVALPKPKWQAEFAELCEAVSGVLPMNIVKHLYQFRGSRVLFGHLRDQEVIGIPSLGVMLQ